MPAPSPVFASHPHAPRVFQVDQDLQRLFDDVMGAMSLDVHDKYPRRTRRVSAEGSYRP
jgi:hypothetical protein